jgi:single-strand DNA-binding protein
VAWGKLAEICGGYLSKSKQVYIERSIRTGNWKDRDGNERKSHDPPRRIALYMQMLSPAANGNGFKAEKTKPAQGSGASEPSQEDNPFREEPGGDSIPF